MEGGYNTIFWGHNTVAPLDRSFIATVMAAVPLKNAVVPMPPCSYRMDCTARFIDILRMGAFCWGGCRGLLILTGISERMCATR